jgi:7-carboxy-7-deazaguanine synthase
MGKEESYLLLAEDFYSLQGEGRFIGTPAYFFRTNNCNLRCSWLNNDGSISKCDTPYSSWAPEKSYKMFFSEMLSKVKETKARHVVATGGEPMLQKGLVDIANEFMRNKYNVTIETNGTRYLEGLDSNIFLSISPKLKTANALNNEQHTKNNIWVDTTRKLISTHPYQLKFVYNIKDDEQEIEKILNSLPAIGKNVYIMAQGLTVEMLQKKGQEIWEMCCKYGWNMTPRMHIDVFGNKKGI